MVVVILRTSVEGDELCGIPGEIVPAVGIDGFQLPQCDPDPECDDVPRHHRRPHERRHSQQDDLCPMCIGSREAHRGHELVMHTVDILVEPTLMQPTMNPIVQVILNNEIHKEM